MSAVMEASAIRWAGVAVQAVGAGGVLLATTRLAWATYRAGVSPTTHFHADSLSHWLIPAAVLSLVIGCLQIAWPRRALSWVASATGAVVAGLCVVEAARRISHANSVSLSATAAGTTSYASGSAIAVLGGLAIVVAGVATGSTWTYLAEESEEPRHHPQ